MLVKDINPTGGSNPGNLTNVNGTFFFRADDGINGAELWKSDGTSGGTVLVKDIDPGIFPSTPDQFVDVNGTLFFIAGVTGIGSELFKTDGTAGGTVLVKDINPTRGSNPGNLTNVNGTLFFAANDGVTGRELWKSDGTTVGTVQVKDINPTGNSSPGTLTNVNGTLFFIVRLPSTGAELWKSDGTAAGTVPVKDILPGPDSGLPQGLTDLNGTLLFTATDGVTGFELWKSDGTEGGTVLVKDIRPGPEPTEDDDSPDNLTVINSTLFFTANDGFTGFELWALESPASPEEQIESLIANRIEPMDIGRGRKNSLIAKLDAAIQHLEGGNEHAAIKKLQDFIDQVSAFIKNGILSSAEGQPVIDAAEAIIDAIQDGLAIRAGEPVSLERVPSQYKVFQNYPNPFNPTTSIQYDLPVAGFVTLKVFDVLGREVAVLVEEHQKAGRYSVAFNAEGLPSGVYLYRIQAGEFVETKKLILLK